MEIIIEWSYMAERQLKAIYNFYSVEVSPRIGRKIVNGLVDHVEVLIKNPLLGPKEELLANYSQEFRYLIQGNYKIIYWIENDIITIASVFDCRQNPEKIKQL